jgi:hypothetical protein
MIVDLPTPPLPIMNMRATGVVGRHTGLVLSGGDDFNAFLIFLKILIIVWASNWTTFENTVEESRIYVGVDYFS